MNRTRQEKETTLETRKTTSKPTITAATGE